MNRNEFLQMINNSVPVNRQSIGEVYELIDIYPYFQSAHLLLLKCLQDSEDVKFENQLRNSAIHIADREVLYNLLNTSKAIAVSDKEGIIRSEELQPDIVNKEQTVIESARNSQDLIVEIEKESESNTAEDIEGSEHTDGHSVLIGRENNFDDDSAIMVLLEDDSSSGEEKIFFMDPGFTAPEPRDLLELDIDEENNDFMTDANINRDNSPEISRKQLQSDLIDKFISANPRIEPNREKADLPVEDISKPFIEHDGGFVTETLAKIYVGQGYYSKAIDIYEKLSLKFPEKSSYFAAQIEKVKEYIKK